MHKKFANSKLFNEIKFNYFKFALWHFLIITIK